MGQAATRLIGGLHGYWKASREQGTRRERSSSLIPLDDTASSSSAPLALVSPGMHINPSEAGGYELPHFITSMRGTNGGGVVVPGALIESLVLLLLRWCRDYELEAQRRLDYDLEAGGQQAHRLGARRTGGGAATPVQELSEVANKMLEGVMVQAYVAFLPVCVTAYPLLKDVPDHIKFTIFGGLAFTTVGLFVGLLSTSVARRWLAIRLVSFSAVAVLAFSVASLLSSPTYIALTALVAVALNLIILLL